MIISSSAVLPDGEQEKGRYSMEVSGKEIRVDGRLVRIASIDAEGFQFLKDPETALKVIRESRKRIDLFTFIQKLSDASPRYTYPMEWDNIAALPVSTFDDWMKNQIDFKVRNKVRKAAKNGLVVREVPFDDALIRGISAVYNESPIRQGRPFWHYQKDLETVRGINGTFLDRSIFIGAFFENNMIGFVKLVTDDDQNQAGLMQIVSMIGHRDKAPTNALVAQAVRSCAERGIPYLTYASFSYGKKQRDSLADFKRHNGFQRVEVPRYYIPLTAIGHVALRLGLHRSMIDWIPEPVTSTYRRIRSFWYDRRPAGLEGA
jgi:hypothetical protein